MKNSSRYTVFIFLILLANTFKAAGQGFDADDELNPVQGHTYIYTYSDDQQVVNPVWESTDANHVTIGNEVFDSSTGYYRYSIRLRWPNHGPGKFLRILDGSAPRGTLQPITVSPGLDLSIPLTTATAPSLVKDKSFQANWQSVSGADYYVLNVDSSGTTVASYEVSLTYRGVSGLYPSADYTYTVNTVMASGYNGPSNAISVHTLPATPATVSAGSINYESFNVAWGSVSSANSYRLEVSTDNTFGTGVSAYTKTTTSHSLTGLSQGTTYYFRVRATDAAGANSAWKFGSATTLTVPVPDGLNVSSTTSDGFRIDWDPVTNADSYEIRVRKYADNTLVATAPKGTCTNCWLTFDGLQPFTKYKVDVKTIIDGYHSAYSGYVIAATRMEPPIVSVVETKLNSITVSWTQAQGADDFQVRLCCDPFFTDVGNANQYTFTTLGGYCLEAGTQYWVQVKAGTGNFVSPVGEVYATTASNPINFGTSIDGIDLCTETVEAVTFTAHDVQNYSSPPDYSWTINGQAYSGNPVTYDITTTDVGINASVEVTPPGGCQVLSSGEVRWSKFIDLTPVPTGLNVPSNTITGDSFRAYWDEMPEANSYEIEVRLYSDGTLVKTQPVPSCTNCWAKVDGLEGYTKYRVSIKAIDNCKRSRPSDEVLIITDLAPPVVSLVENGYYEFMVSWTKPKGAIDYHIGLAKLGSGTQWFHNIGDVNQYSFSQYSGECIEALTNYRVKVTALRNSLASSPGELDFTTLANPLPDVGVQIVSPVQENHVICPGTSQEIDFEAEAVGYLTEPSYRWVIKGQVLTGKNITYTVSGEDSFQVKVTAMSNEGCPARPDATATKNMTFTYAVVPNQYVLTGSFSCTSSSGSVSLNGSQTGISYQLRLDGTDIGSPRAGTGSSLSWSGLAEGIYTVVASHTSSGCAQELTTSTVIARPLVYAGHDLLVFDGSIQVLDGAMPEGGTWSGPGVTGNNFNPSGLSNGEHLITYTYSGTDGCNGSDVRSISIIPGVNENFISTTSSREPAIAVNNIPYEEQRVSRSTDYFDGLGRPMQTVAWRATPGSSDLVQPIEYDDLGRQEFDYLPYANGNDGLYKTNFLGATNAGYTTNSPQYEFYNVQSDAIENSANPYSRRVYELSPLNRVIKQGAPGTPWQPDLDPAINTDRVVRTDYETNGLNEVPYWQISGGLPQTSTYYGIGQLYKNVTTDEAFNRVIEYADKRGQTLLKKVETGDAANPWAETHYVYDDYGNLHFVLPPQIFEGGSYAVSAGELSDLAFQYQYDRRDRMIAKKVPGAGWVYMVYDQWDRLVLTQDANQRLNGEWLFTKYDVMNRPVLTGIYNNPSGIGAMRSIVENHSIRFETFDFNLSGNVEGYSNNSFPVTDGQDEILTVTYYDHYTFTAESEWQGYGFAAKLNHASGDELTAVKGLVTGSKVKILENSDNWIRSVSYYNKRYRLIQSVSSNYLGGKDHTTNVYDFPGNLVETLLEHDNTNDTIPIHRWFAYDHANRLLKITHQLGTEPPVTLAAHHYNELGELITKDLHATLDGNNSVTGSHQNVDYRYNIRGWLKRINTSDLVPNEPKPDLFGMELIYNDNVNGIPTGN